MLEIDKFNIRVYGILTNRKNEILLVHEKFSETEIIKFPGGGLEFGEGTKECIIREFKEETDLDVEVIEHFYTTDFFQQSAFKKSDQIVSIYYKVKTSIDPIVSLNELTLTNGNKTEKLRFFWVPISVLKEEMLTLPIDKIVCKMISQL